MSKNLDLKPTRLQQVIDVEDDGGYSFSIVAEWDEEWGWGAQVVMTTHGLKTPEDAVKHLQKASEHFIELLKRGDNVFED